MFIHFKGILCISKTNEPQELNWLPVLKINLWLSRLVNLEIPI